MKRRSDSGRRYNGGGEFDDYDYQRRNGRSSETRNSYSYSYKRDLSIKRSRNRSRSRSNSKDYDDSNDSNNRPSVKERLSLDYPRDYNYYKNSYCPIDDYIPDPISITSVKKRLSIDPISNSSEEIEMNREGSFETETSDQEANKYDYLAESTGLRITIDNDKYLKNNQPKQQKQRQDSNNNNMMLINDFPYPLKSDLQSRLSLLPVSLMSQLIPSPPQPILTNKFASVVTPPFPPPPPQPLIPSLLQQIVVNENHAVAPPPPVFSLNKKIWENNNGNGGGNTNNIQLTGNGCNKNNGFRFNKNINTTNSNNNSSNNNNRSNNNNNNNQNRNFNNNRNNNNNKKPPFNNNNHKNVQITTNTSKTNQGGSNWDDDFTVNTNTNKNKSMFSHLIDENKSKQSSNESLNKSNNSSTSFNSSNSSLNNTISNTSASKKVLIEYESWDDNLDVCATTPRPTNNQPTKRNESLNGGKNNRNHNNNKKPFQYNDRDAPGENLASGLPPAAPVLMQKPKTPENREISECNAAHEDSEVVVDYQCEFKVEHYDEEEYAAKVQSNGNNSNKSLYSAANKAAKSPSSSLYSNSSLNTLLLSSNNLVIDEDYTGGSQSSNSFYSKNQYDASPNTGNYSSLIELKENVFERKYNFKVCEFNIMKLKQKKLKEQQQQFQTQQSQEEQAPKTSTAAARPTEQQLQQDYQKHDYYEINRKLQESLRKQKLLFTKASNLLNNELKMQIINDNLNKRFNVNRQHSNLDAVEYSCKQCNCTFDKISAHLNHLYSEEHLKHIGSLSSSSAASTSNTSSVLIDELSSVEKSPFKGVEFLFPTKSFYCSLCDELCDNETLTELHLRSVSHNQKYQELMEQ